MRLVLAALLLMLLTPASAHASCATMQALAQEHANDMARRGSMDHNGFASPRAAWSASRKCSLRRQDKAASHCVMVEFIWPRSQHETAGMQGSGERGGAQRHALLGNGDRELRYLPRRR